MRRITLDVCPNLFGALLLIPLLAGCDSPITAPGDVGNSTLPEVDSTILAQLADVHLWKASDTATLGDNDYGDLVRYGRDLIVNTAKYLGPRGSVSQHANGLNCQNCHLYAGTLLFGNSFGAVYSGYPKFRNRSGTIEDMEMRVNDCMERSMNGQKLDRYSREMQAMIAYLKWVGKDVPKGERPPGATIADLPYMDRAADPALGEIAFKKHFCIVCHGKEGQGILNNDSITYRYPPLWGPDSYTTAAGMYRLSRFAGFIKYNMPYEAASVGKPALTNAEAWDIAAYVNSKPRPVKKFEGDWPDISKKPIDSPSGPYSDHFSEKQHKYGPYKAIADALKKN